MACGAMSVAWKPGSRSRALAMNSCTASDDAMPAASAAADGHASGGTVQQTSPGTPSRTRLVTTMRSPGTVPSSAVTRLAASSRSDSAPSSTSSRRDSASAARSESVSETPGWSCTPSVDASAGASERGSRTDSSGRNTTSARGQAAPDHLGREPRLAGPAGADEADEPGLLEHRGQLGQFLFPADEARLRERQLCALRAGRGPGPEPSGPADQPRPRVQPRDPRPPARPGATVGCGPTPTGSRSRRTRRGAGPAVPG